MTIQAREHYMNSGHPTLQDPALIPDEFDDITHHLALAFDHHSRAYVDFLQGQDVFPEQEKVLEERYGMLLTQVVYILLIALQPGRTRESWPTWSNSGRGLSRSKRSGNSSRSLRSV